MRIKVAYSIVLTLALVFCLGAYLPLYADEEDLYQDTYHNTVEFEGVYQDATLEAYVRKIGKSLEKATDYTGPPVEYLITDSPIVNAFALPPNHIFLNRGLLAYMNSEAELAFVMGHELGHLQGRHVPKRLSQIKNANLFQWFSRNLIIPLLNLGGLGSSLADLSVQLTVVGSLNQFSRSEESEADQLGFRTMNYASYRPEGAVKSLKQISLLSEGRPDLFYYLMSSHPLTPDRIKEAEKFRDEHPEKAEGKVNREIYFKQIDGMEVGTSIRLGKVEGNKYQNKYYQFSFEIPNGWESHSTGGAPLLLAKEGEIFKLQVFDDRTPQTVQTETESRYVKQMKAKLTKNETRTVLGNTARYQQYERRMPQRFYWPWEVPLDATSWDAFLLLMPKGGDTFQFAYFRDPNARSDGEKTLLELANRVTFLPATREATSEATNEAVSLRTIKMTKVPPGKSFQDLSLQFYETQKYAKDLAEMNGKRENEVTDYPLVKVPPSAFFDEKFEAKKPKPRALRGGFSIYGQWNTTGKLDRTDVNGTVNHPLTSPGLGTGLYLTFPAGSQVTSSIGAGYYFSRARTDVADASFTAIPVRFDVDLYPFGQGPWGEFLYFKFGSSYTIMNRVGSGWTDGLTPDPGLGQLIGIGASRGDLFLELGYALDRVNLKDGSGNVVNFLDQGGLYLRFGSWF